MGSAGVEAVARSEERKPCAAFRDRFARLSAKRLWSPNRFEGQDWVRSSPDGVGRAKFTGRERKTIQEWIAFVTSWAQRIDSL